MTNAFVQDALKLVGSPQILVNIVSKRVRQLGQGFRPMVMAQPRWTFMDIALREVVEGKLAWENLEEAPKPEGGKKRRKRS